MTSTPGRPAARGFTAIELSVVISVMAILSGMTTHVVVGALRGAAVDQAAAAVELAVATATDHARRATLLRSVEPARLTQFDARRFGLVLVDASAGQPAWVGLTWGSSANAEDLYLRSDGEPVFKQDLPQGVRILEERDGALAHRSELGWLYDHGSARPMARVGAAASMLYIGAADLGAEVIDPAGTVRLAGTVHIGSADGRATAQLELRPDGQVGIR
jgi:prepilin-type N-terminal cleavage/methylation domain-containing protein